MGITASEKEALLKWLWFKAGFERGGEVQREAVLDSKSQKRRLKNREQEEMKDLKRKGFGINGRRRNVS